MTDMRPPWFDLATAAFHAASRDDLDAGLRYVDQIVAEHGPDVMPRVMLAWIDTTLYAALGPDYRREHEGHVHGLRFALGDGPFEDIPVDQVAPASLWAGRLVNARLADDPETFHALLLAAQGSPARWGEHVGTLLQDCALTARAGRQHVRRRPGPG